LPVIVELIASRLPAEANGPPHESHGTMGGLHEVCNDARPWRL